MRIIRIKKLLGIYVLAFESIDESCNETRPSCLMASTYSSAVVAMEVLVKENVIAPVWILLELLCIAEHRSLPFLVEEEDAGKTVCNLPSNLEKVHLMT